MLRCQNSQIHVTSYNSCDAIDSEKIELLSPRIDQINGDQVSSANDGDNGAVLGDEIQIQAVGKIQDGESGAASRLHHHSEMQDGGNDVFRISSSAFESSFRF